MAMSDELANEPLKTIHFTTRRGAMRAVRAAAILHFGVRLSNLAISAELSADGEAEVAEEWWVLDLFTDIGIQSLPDASVAIVTKHGEG
jgi:hypothetical protein